MKRTLVTVADVQEYARQIDRSLSQGGSSLDWLAFPVSSRSGEALRMPSAHPDIIKHFLQGRVTYVPKGVDAQDKQIVRQIRPLLGIPCLEIAEESQKAFTKDLRGLVKQVQTRNATDEKIAKEFEKAIRNARFPAACNYFAIPKPNHTEIDVLIRTISRSLLQERKIPAIPEFLPSISIEARPDLFDPGNLRKNGLLISYEQFILQHTDNGILYHGTSSTESMLSMIRCGLIVSTNQPDRSQGSAALGRGFYMTLQRSFAQEYTRGGFGELLRFPVSSSRKLRVMELEKLSSRQRNYLEKAAKNEKMDLHEYLAQELSVDILVFSSVSLIQNADAVVLPKTVEGMIANILSSYDLLLKQISQFETKISPDLVNKLLEYERFLSQDWTLFLAMPENLPFRAREMLLSWLKSGDPVARARGVTLLNILHRETVKRESWDRVGRRSYENQKIFDWIGDVKALLKDPDLNAKITGLKILERIMPLYPIYWPTFFNEYRDEFSSAFLEILSHSDAAMIMEALDLIENLNVGGRSMYQRLFDIFENTAQFDEGIRKKIVTLLDDRGFEFPVIVKESLARQLLQEVYRDTPCAKGSFGFLRRVLLNPEQTEARSVVQQAFFLKEGPEYTVAGKLLSS